MKTILNTKIRMKPKVEGNDIVEQVFAFDKRTGITFISCIKMETEFDIGDHSIRHLIINEIFNQLRKEINKLFFKDEEILNVKS